jgi:hypothetical protein
VKRRLLAVAVEVCPQENNFARGQSVCPNLHTANSRIGNKIIRTI